MLCRVLRRFGQQGTSLVLGSKATDRARTCSVNFESMEQLSSSMLQRWERWERELNSFILQVGHCDVLVEVWDEAVTIPQGTRRPQDRQGASSRPRQSSNSNTSQSVRQRQFSQAPPGFESEPAGKAPPDLTRGTKPLEHTVNRNCVARLVRAAHEPQPPHFCESS